MLQKITYIKTIYRVKKFIFVPKFNQFVIFYHE